VCGLHLQGGGQGDRGAGDACVALWRLALGCGACVRAHESRRAPASSALSGNRRRRPARPLPAGNGGQEGRYIACAAGRPAPAGEEGSSSLGQPRNLALSSSNSGALSAHNSQFVSIPSAPHGGQGGVAGRHSLGGHELCRQVGARRRAAGVSVR
jgi:hypothetical protein